MKLKGKIPGPNHPDILELSALLQSLPFHPKEKRKGSFRNPNGVIMKLQNLNSVQTGRGLSGKSGMDVKVWNELKNSPAKVSEIADSIRKALVSVELKGLSQSDFEIPTDEQFYEGRILTVIHQKRERNEKIRPALLKERSKVGSLKCDICHFFFDGNPALADAALEVHHIVPHSDLAERYSNLSDFALLCAVCHRLIHKAMNIQRKWLGIDDAKALLTSSRKY
jgi:5-methylcytosine-specific restriction protein A